MPNKTWISIVVGVVIPVMVGFAALSAAVRGRAVDWETVGLLAGGIGIGVTLANSLFRAVDKWFGRSRVVRLLPLPDKPPVLHSTWRMRFTRDDGKTWEPCYLVIRQQFSAIEPTLFFKDGRSDVLSAALRAGIERLRREVLKPLPRQQP